MAGMWIFFLKPGYYNGYAVAFYMLVLTEPFALENDQKIN
jgi:hypothetical protein